MHTSRTSFSSIIHSFGLVFGDIGTSPLYTLTVVFGVTERTEANFIGVLSLVIWTITLVVFIEYAWLAMSLSKKGEGGTIVLKEILMPLLKSRRFAGVVSLLSFIGISLLIGDGVITPAISILSAVEGVALIPGLSSVSTDLLVFVAALIAVALFSLQHKGTEKVAGTFGPIMLLWFSILAVSGLISIMHAPQVVNALNPQFALAFLLDHGVAGFFVLSEVILCATGGEALYADMGHLGRKPIIDAWYFVYISLILNYMGQTAFLIQSPQAKNIFFEMIFNQTSLFYVPFLILSILATVIASQAMISGMFSIVYQSMSTRVMPMFKVEYTSKQMHSQIYIGAVNYFLMIAVLIVMYEFCESGKLAAAYGLAVTGTMTLTGLFMMIIFWLKKQFVRCVISGIVFFVDGVYLLANFYKIPHGGYWSLLIAALPFILILLYTRGQYRLYRRLRPMDRACFVEEYRKRRDGVRLIEGTALFFARSIDRVPPYMVITMFDNGVMYDENIIVSVVQRDDPFGVAWFFREELAEGLRLFEIQVGYMEILDMEKILRDAQIEPRTIFYGVEEIIAQSFIWKLFAFIKRLTPSFVQFYRLPAHLLHGVVVRVEL